MFSKFIVNDQNSIHGWLKQKSAVQTHQLLKVITIKVRLCLVETEINYLFFIALPGNYFILLIK